MRVIFAIILFLLFQALIAQEPDHFIQRLKDNSDQQVLTRVDLNTQLNDLDTVKLIKLFEQIEKSTKTASEKIKTRVAALKARSFFYRLGPGDSLYTAQMKDALYKAYELDEAFMMAEYSRWYSEMLNTVKKKEDAVQYGLNALQLQETLGVQYFPGFYSFCLSVGEMFYKNRNMREGITYLNKGLNGALNEKVDPRSYANGLNTLGAIYKYLQIYDSSLMAFIRCMDYSQANGIEDWYYLASDNRYDAYIELGQYDSCYVIANGLFNEGVKTNDPTLLMPAYFLLGRLAYRQAQYHKAIPLLLKSEQFALQQGYRPNNVKTYKDLAACYDSIGRPDLAFVYFRLHLQLKDTLDHRDLRVNTNYLFAKANFEKELLEFKRLKATREKGIIFRNIGIISLIIVSGFCLWLLNRRRRKAQRLQAAAEKQLDFFREEMIARNQQIEILMTGAHTQEHNHQKAEKVEELAHQIILTEDDWLRFQSMFNKVYPGFFHRLKEKAAGITEAEARLSSLIKIQLNTKQIASMQGVSADAVHKTKQRLRQRFNTPSTAELEAIITSV